MKAKLWTCRLQFQASTYSNTHPRGKSTLLALFEIWIVGLWYMRWTAPCSWWLLSAVPQAQRSADDAWRPFDWESPNYICTQLSQALINSLEHCHVLEQLDVNIESYNDTDNRYELCLTKSCRALTSKREYLTASEVCCGQGCNCEAQPNEAAHGG